MLQVKISGINGAGKFATVDPADYELVMRHSWHYRNGYAITQIGGKEVRMHRLIMGITDPDIVVDHKDQNRLNNTRQNLRCFNLVQNANNRKTNVKVRAFGEEKTVAEWSRDSRCCVSYDCLQKRLAGGAPVWAAILASHPRGDE